MENFGAQAAALAEFRADWATAVKTYQNSYAEIARVPLGPPLPLQRAWEVAAVAEQVQVKVGNFSLILEPLLLPCLCVRAGVFALVAVLSSDACRASSIPWSWPFLLVSKVDLLFQILIVRNKSLLDCKDWCVEKVPPHEQIIMLSRWAHILPRK